MKNPTKRNKIVIAIVGVLVVAVIAAVGFSQVGGEVLFGTVTSISISPSSSTIIVGQSETLSSNTSFSDCSWISSNTSVVSITSSSAKSATVLAKGTGTATITEKCGTLSGSATVTVNPPPTSTPTPKPTNTPTPKPTNTPIPTATPTYLYITPANPVIGVSDANNNQWKTVTLRVVNAVGMCRWQVPSSEPSGYFSWNGNEATVASGVQGTKTVTAQCNNGSVSTSVSFNASLP